MQQVVQGQITQVEPRANGWAAVHIATPGQQYPKKLSTKRPELIGAAQSLFGQFVEALYNEEEGTNINPNSGRPYVNRYLEQLAPAGSGLQAQVQPQVQPQQQGPQAVPTTMMQPQVQPQQFGNLQPQLPPQPQYAPPPQVQPMQLPPQGEHVADGDRESRIMRQAATKVAASFLPMLAEEDRNLGSLIRISEQLLKYYREGVSWETNPIGPDGGPQQQGQQQMPVGNPAGYENPNEYGDPGREQGDPRGEFPEGY